MFRKHNINMMKIKKKFRKLKNTIDKILEKEYYVIGLEN